MNDGSEEIFYQSTTYKTGILLLGLVILIALIANYLALHRLVIEDLLGLVAFGYFLVSWKEPVARVTNTRLFFGATPLFRKSLILNCMKSVELTEKTARSMKIVILYDDNGKQRTLTIPAYIVTDYQRLFSILQSRLVSNTQLFFQQFIQTKLG